MATQVFLSNWTIYFAGDAAGDKEIRWTGTTGSTDINLWYSELMHYFNIAANNVADATTPVKFDTPTEYQIGAFDQGDKNPWFINDESIKHLTGGSLKTANWTRNPLVGDGTGTIGIIKIAYTIGAGTDMAASLADVGKAIVDNTNSDAGTVLYYTRAADGDANEIWIRPDSNTAADNFDNSPQNTNIDVTGGTGTNLTQTTATSAVTGERIWPNIYTLGGIVSGTQMYITQSDALISNTEDSGSGAWWGTDHIDVLILINDEFDAGLIDKGLLTIYGRDYLQGYDDFQIDVSAGGRNPVPLSIGPDSNNTVSQATADAYNVTLNYAVDLLGDIGDGGGDQPYDCTVSTSSGTVTVQQMYEALKEHTRLGETGAIDTNGGDVAIPGEQYKGGEIQLTLTSQTTDWVIGNTCTGTLSGVTATGIVIGTIDDGGAGDDKINLSNIKGTFVDSMVLTSSGSGDGTVASSGVATIPAKDSPLATFAGGKLFLAQGIFMDTAALSAGQSTLYEIIDNNGVTRTPPIERSFTVTGMKAGTEVRMYTDDGLRTEVVSTQSPSPGIENSTSYINSISDVSITSGGTNYNVNDILTIVEGTGTAIQLTVATVSGTTITGLTLTNGGLYTVTPPLLTSTHTNGGEGGGSGTNATFTFKFTATAFLFKYIYGSEPLNGSDLDVYIQVMHLSHPYIKLETTLTDADQSIPVSQSTDRTYSN